MNADQNSKKTAQFLEDYAEIIPIIKYMRSKGFSLVEIANELNQRGFLTREKSQFSHVQILRVLARLDKIEVKKSELSDSARIDELFQRVASLQNEILELRQQVDQLRNQSFDSGKANKKIPNSARQKAVEMAVAMRADNPMLSKSEMARTIAADLGLKFETVRDWLKRM